MTTRTSGIQQLVGEITNERLFVLDTDNVMWRKEASDFRGAGIFDFGENTPTETPHINGATWAYKTGDIAYTLIANIPRLYTWNAAADVGSRWGDGTALKGTTVQTRLTLGTDVFEVFEGSPVDDVRLGDGDFYLNQNLKFLIGPYQIITGLNIDFRDRDSFMPMRSSMQHTNSVARADAWSPSDLTTAGDATDLALYPIAGDTYWQEWQDPLHGGRSFVFSETDYQVRVTAGDAQDLCVQAAWSLSTINNGFTRDPKRFYFAGAPTQLDTRYITGDVFTDITNGFDYDTGYVIGAADLSAAWGVPVSNKGTIIHNGTEVNPARNDETYAVGSFYLTSEGNTFRMYGPYVTGQTTDVLAWPGRTILRGSLQHSGTADLIAAAPFVLSGTRIEVGDEYLKINAGSPKRHIFKVTAVDHTTGSETITWDTGYNPRQGFTHTGGNNYPSISEHLYATGDYFRTTNGCLFGPYSQAGQTDKTAWPLRDLGSPVLHSVDVVDQNAAVSVIFSDYTPNLKAGDVIRTNITGSTKFIDYRVDTLGTSEDYEPTGAHTITKLAKTRPDRIHPNTTTGRLAQDDTIYWTGDLMIDSTKAMYGPYVEGAASLDLAWPVLSPGTVADAVEITQDVTGTVWTIHMDEFNKPYFRST